MKKKKLKTKITHLEDELQRKEFHMSEDTVKAIIKKFTGYLKQEMEGNSDEILGNVLNKHCAAMSRHSWKNAQKWCKWNDDGPVLMPDNTRIYYRKGTTEVVLLEYPPQVRILKFQEGLYSVALPYLVFVLKFVNGALYEMKLAFSDRPLKTLDEQPLKPYLTNLDQSLKVCLGADFPTKQMIVGDIVQQSALVLDFFWSAGFNHDWATNFTENQVHFKAINDKRLITVEAWQKAARENHLFVIEDVQWLKTIYVSFGDMLVRCLDGDEQDCRLRQELYEELNTGFIEEAKKAYRSKLELLETKILENKMSEFTSLL